MECTGTVLAVQITREDRFVQRKYEQYAHEIVRDEHKDFNFFFGFEKHMK